MVGVLRESFAAVAASDIADYGEGYGVGDFLHWPEGCTVDWIITNPPFAVLLSGDKDLIALATLELPTAAEFDEPVAPGVRPGEVGVYSHGDRLITMINIEELVNSQPDLSRAS